jgi:glyoxylase-like metal-dependent hydrolase (beta-lactamase superfamily II)
MVGYYPDECPFCRAAKENFISMEEYSARYRVEGMRGNDKVTRLNSVPALGLEHAAYRIETAKKTFWIDCPSSFDKSLKRADALVFTHHHFLGASNLYRELFSAEVRIHKSDSAHEICRAFTFDSTFEKNFEEDGIEAFHIAGHTPGFTMYFFGDVLLICDYVFLQKDLMTYNPYGPADETIAGGGKIRDILRGREISKVCGYNYVVDYSEWKPKFERGPLFLGH